MGKRLGVYLFGLALTAFGISLIILSRVGAGPFDIVAVGLNKHLGLTVGTWSIISQGCVVLLTSCIERKRPQWESVIAIIIRSWLLDFWLYLVFQGADFSSSAGIQWLSFVIGTVSVGSGIGCYVLAEFPKTPVDGLMIAIQQRFRWSFNKARTIIESTAGLVGFLLGGPVGIGTIIIALGLGRLVQFTNGWMKKWYQRPQATMTGS